MWRETLKKNYYKPNRNRYGHGMKDGDNLEGKRKEFLDKKTKVIEEYSTFVLKHLRPDIWRRTKVLDTNFGGNAGGGSNIFRKIYVKASKETQTLYTKNLITEENYKTYDVDKKMNELRQALEKYKEMYKEQIAEFAKQQLEEYKEGLEYEQAQKKLRFPDEDLIRRVDEALAMLNEKINKR